MKKTDLGFQAEINLISSNLLNLCFRNSNNEWDNNNGQNYVFEIEPQEISLIPIEKNSQLTSSRRLKKSYIWSKKIRLAIFKIIYYLPKLISGNYKRKLSSTNQ